MFHCENFTGVVNSVFDQRASFMVVFEKQWVHVANVSDEVLQANHDVDVESNLVQLPDCGKKGAPIGEKRTVGKVHSMSNAQLQEPGHVVGVLHRNDAESQQDDFSESSLRTECDADAIVRMALMVETINLQNRQRQHILKFCNWKSHKQSAKHGFLPLADRLKVWLECSGCRRVFTEELLETCRELVAEKLRLAD